MRGTSRRKAVCIVLIAVNLAVIWGNSLMTGADSGAMSGSVMEFVRNLLNLPESVEAQLHHFIRKAAHFTEFACLGILMTWLLGMLGQKGLQLASCPVFLGLAVACVDETIQIFTEGRASSLVDVWIDTCGAAAGMMMLLTGHYLYEKSKHNQKHLEETT